MKIPQFEQKLRRLLEQKGMLFHETTKNNAVSALEHGLMSLEKAKEQGIEVEKGEFFVSFFPYAVSMIYHSNHNYVKEKGNFPRQSSCYILIDEKYLSIEGAGSGKGLHPIFEGIIPPVDLLALETSIESQDLPESCKELIEMQRQRLSPDKWTPVIYSLHLPLSRFHEPRSGLYLPKGLEISDEIREIIAVIDEK